MNSSLFDSFLKISNRIELIIQHCFKVSANTKVAAAKVLFTTHWIFLDFQDIDAYLLLLLIKRIKNPPCDDAFLKFANAASLLHCSIFPRFGNCNETFSDFKLQIYLFVIARSLIFASATLVLHHYQSFLYHVIGA